MTDPVQLELVGLLVPGVRSREQVEAVVLDAARACEFSRWMAFRAKYRLDGLHPAGRRRRRRRSLVGARYWSEVAFEAAKSLEVSHGR